MCSVCIKVHTDTQTIESDVHVYARMFVGKRMYILQSRMHTYIPQEANFPTSKHYGCMCVLHICSCLHIPEVMNVSMLLVCVHVCTCLHTCIHTYIHTYIHTPEEMRSQHPKAQLCAPICVYVRTYV